MENRPLKSLLCLLAVFISLADGVTIDESKKIVDFDQSRIKVSLDNSAVESIIQSHSEIQNLPTAVISIGGLARSGKSFLLNLFVNYLTYLEQNGSDDDWERSNTNIEGINWAQSETPVTNGIWMWSRPFIVKRPDGTKIAVLLVDTQGTGDNTRSEKLNTLIMYMSLQISSVQMLNMWKYLRAEDLSSLQLCAEYVDGDDRSNSQQTSKSEHLFQSLVFVLRDYQASGNFGEDSSTFSDILRKSADEDSKKVALGIRKAFEDITTYKLPYPGDMVTLASAREGAIGITDVRPVFVLAAKDLMRRTTHLSGPQNSHNYWPSANSFLHTFKSLQRHIEMYGLPEFHTSADALQFTIIFRAYSVALKEFTKSKEKMEDKEVLTSYSSKIELSKALDQLTDSCVELFKQDGNGKKYSDTSIWKKYRKLLDENINSGCKEILTKYQTQIDLARAEAKIDEVEKEAHLHAEKMDHKLAEADAAIKAEKELGEKRDKEAKEKIANLEKKLEDVRSNPPQSDDGFGLFGALLKSFTDIILHAIK